jgi:hypothetical protein
VQIEAGERQFMRRTDDEGRIGFLIQPEVAYQVTAGRFGFETMRTQLRGLIDGEHRPEKIALERQSEMATIMIQDAGTFRTNHATFELRQRFPTGGKAVDIRKDVVRDPRTHLFAISNVPAGSVRISMTSSLPLGMGSRLPRNCDRDELVQVPDHGELEVQMRAVERGGLKVSTHTEDGTPVDAALDLKDTRGESVDGLVVLANEPRGMYEYGILEATPEVLLPGDLTRTNGEAYVWSSWCAGTADLFVSAPGMVTSTIRVAIVAGELTPVNLVLHRQ